MRLRIFHINEDHKLISSIEFKIYDDITKKIVFIFSSVLLLLFRFQ